MNPLRSLSSTTLPIQVVNLCVTAWSDVWPTAGPIVEMGSHFAPGYAELCDRRLLFRNVEYIGCDMRQGPGVDRLEDAENLTFPSDYAGMYISLDTIEHFRNPARAIAEARRVLRRDGVLILSTPFWYRLHGFPTDYWRFTASGIHELLADFPMKTVVALGAAVKPSSIFAVASKSASPEFEKAQDAFKGHLAEIWGGLRRRLFLYALMDRTRDLVGLVTGRAELSTKFFDVRQSGGYHSHR